METFQPLLLDWYAKNKRDLPFRQDKDPYKIWVSEIMAQQTRIEAMTGHFQTFIARYPDIPALAQADQDALHKAWQGLGYYARCRNLQKAARICMEQHNGKLPRDPDQLLALPGIGPYTCGAIASIAYGLPVPAVDGNVIRVYARLENDHSQLLDPAGKRKVTRWVRQAMIPPYGDFTQALMELGSLVCTPQSPACMQCPVAAMCKAENPAALPVPAPKKARKEEEKWFLVKTDGTGLLLEKRPAKGLLAGLYGFPETDRIPEGAIPLQDHIHLFTHIKWVMHGALLFTGPDDAYIPLDQVLAHCSVPSAFQPFLKQAMEIIYGKQTTRH